MVLAILRRLIADETGTTAVEYALIAAIVSLAGLGAFSALGRDLVDIFEDVETGMTLPPL
jgi:pilus assembly protein Flp/PilA